LAQRLGDPGHPDLERQHHRGRWGWAVENLQVEQHLPGGMQR
jgi:hypothetical protein